MLDCLVVDVLNLLSSMLELTEVINLSFVCRSLRDFVGTISQEDVLGYCIRDVNLRLYYEYLNRLHVFPLRLAADLGRTGNLEMIEYAERHVSQSDLYNFYFNLARGLLIGENHILFTQKAPYLNIKEFKAAISDYFDNLRRATQDADTIAFYISILTGEQLTVTQLANIMRVYSDFHTSSIDLAIRDGVPRKTLQYAALEADSAVLFLHYTPVIWEDRSHFYPFSSLRLAKEVAIQNNEFYIGVLIHHHEIDLLLENIDILYAKLPFVIGYMFKTLDESELERILSHERRYTDDFFHYLPRKREYFNLVLNHGYTLSACSIIINLNEVKRASARLVFNPPITSIRDLRLGFLELLRRPYQLTEFIIRHEDKIKVNYEELLCEETKDLLIAQKKLTARYCSRCITLFKDWIAVWGTEDLDEKDCERVYYHFSTNARLGKRSRDDIDKLLEYVEKNKKSFIRGIIRARAGNFKYEALKAILEHFTDLSEIERKEIEATIGKKEDTLRRYKRQKK